MVKYRRNVFKCHMFVWSSAGHVFECHIFVWSSAGHMLSLSNCPVYPLNTCPHGGWRE